MNYPELARRVYSYAKYLEDPTADPIKANQKVTRDKIRDILVDIGFINPDRATKPSLSLFITSKSHLGISGLENGHIKLNAGNIRLDQDQITKYSTRFNDTDFRDFRARALDRIGFTMDDVTGGGTAYNKEMAARAYYNFVEQQENLREAGIRPEFEGEL